MVKQSTSSVAECGGGHGSAALSVDEALQQIASQVQPVSGFEKVALRSALGRVLAEDIYSPVDVPAHTNSAMDGYAIKHADLSESGTTELKVIGTSLAGKPFSGAVAHSQCVRIMTGAVMPDGTDTVIMQEQVEYDGDTARIGGKHKGGQNVRMAGEDLHHGQLVFAAGKQVSPPELGMLASLGVAEVVVKRRVRVAFFSTGDELRSIGEILSKGEIYDSNRYSLFAMLSRLGVDIIDMGVVRDDRDATEGAFLEAARCADVIITSGGVSVGEADYVKETLDAIGRVSFWQIAIKPGRPLAFGHVQDSVFFGLPGNPVSVMVTFYQFVDPALRRIMGQSDTNPVPAFRVRCESRLKKSPGRMEFQRALLERDVTGELVVRTTGQQGSGLLHSMSNANCFVILPQDSGTVEPGTLVEVQPFHGII